MYAQYDSAYLATRSTSCETCISTTTSVICAISRVMYLLLFLKYISYRFLTMTLKFFNILE